MGDGESFKKRFYMWVHFNFHIHPFAFKHGQLKSHSCSNLRCDFQISFFRVKDTQLLSVLFAITILQFLHFFPSLRLIYCWFFHYYTLEYSSKGHFTNWTLFTSKRNERKWNLFFNLEWLFRKTYGNVSGKLGKNENVEMEKAFIRLCEDC